MGNKLAKVKPSFCFKKTNNSEVLNTNYPREYLVHQSWQEQYNRLHQLYNTYPRTAVLRLFVQNRFYGFVTFE